VRPDAHKTEKEILASRSEALLAVVAVAELIIIGLSNSMRVHNVGRSSGET